MTLLEKLCEELGEEIDEAWRANDGNVYTITDSRIIERYKPKEYSNTDYKGWIVSDDDVYASILKGEIKPVWKPSVGDEYFYPWVDEVCKEERFCSSNWTNHKLDIWRYESGLVFHTQEDAIACANKMLESIK